MRKLYWVLVGLTGLTASGCGVIPPQVSYSQAPRAEDLEKPSPFGYPFRHRRSVILVSYDSKVQAFKADVAPHELDRDGKYLPLYRVAGLDDWRSTTQLKVTYLENTKLVDTLQTTTKDNVADTIKQLGEVATALVSAGIVAENKVASIQFKPTLVDPLEFTTAAWVKDDLNPGYCLRLRDVADEPGITLEKYYATRGGSRNIDFPVAACSTGTVEVAACDSTGKVTGGILGAMRVVYAQGSTVTPMTLPSSGTLKMSSTCGASVTEADSQNRYQLLTYLNNVITQANNVKAAKKNKEKT